ncbi:MAG: hypothetical protein ACRDGW_00890, partial [Actinomycetota bacterium]
MNDLERELRSVLEREAGDAPSPHETRTALRRTRRRQLRTVAATSLGVAAAVIVAVAGFRSLGGEPDRLVPASTTETLNGISITYPETWHLIDPDEAGMNGPDATEDLPRLILALSPTDPGDVFGCPALGQTPGPPPTFLLTIQEMPLALAGDPARPWPVELEPLEVEASESACYPGWLFSQTAWSAAGRTFVAAVGIAPEASETERDALLAAFASMTFEPVAGTPAAAVIDVGEIDGEEWELIASRDAGGVSLSLQTDDQGAGIGGLGEAAGGGDLQFAQTIVGSGDGARVLVFGVLPPGTAEVECSDPAAVRTIDIPDAIDDRFEAFVVDLEPGVRAEVQALDDAGNVIASARVGRKANDAVETPLPAEGELEDGRHFGFIRAVHPTERTIEFDLAYWLTGEEANQAYQEATRDTGPVPNDYFVVNDNPRLRELALSPDLRLVLLDWNRCCDTFFEGKLDLFAQAIEEQADVLDGDVVYRG